MKFVGTLILLLFWATGTLLADLFPTQPQAELKLPKWRLELGTSVITVPVAITSDQRALGLMYRTSLGPNEGMLFIFEAPRRVAFWMKNTFIPLSVAYIHPSGTIQEIHDLKPLNEELVWSLSSSILYALEMPKGWFAKHGIGPGTVIRGLMQHPKDLAQSSSAHPKNRGKESHP